MLAGFGEQYGPKRFRQWRCPFMCAEPLGLEAGHKDGYRCARERQSF